MSDKSDVPWVSYSTFVRAWKKHCASRVLVRKHQRFALCDTCIMCVVLFNDLFGLVFFLKTVLCPGYSGYARRQEIAKLYTS